MGRWTTAEIFEGLSNAEALQGRVHWVQHLPFGGRPGHHYVLRRHRRAPTDAELARTSQQSHNAEVALTRVNDTYIVFVGNTHVATATLWIPRVQDGIESFRWLAHTHPLEQEDAGETVRHGPSPDDRRALSRVKDRWGQTESKVIVCRRGRVERVVPFGPEEDDAGGGRRGGRIWTPDPD